jgi:small subunit ribosomal protein S2
VQKTAITDLLEAGVHFGHQTKRWNPKMKPYIYGTRNGITIFDLTITMRHLAEACEFLRDTVSDGGRVLFVGAKRQAQETVREVAERCGMFYMCDRWLGGTLTNQRVVLSRVNYMKKLQQMETDGSSEQLTKKEMARFRREREKLERTLGGIADMKGLPAALVVVDVGREHIALKEANKLGIPVVALVDSNCDPEPVDYVIPGNDDALRAIKVIVDTLAGAITDGLNMQGKEGGEGVPEPAAAPAAAPEAAPEAAAETEEPAESEEAAETTADDDAAAATAAAEQTETAEAAAAPEVAEQAESETETVAEEAAADADASEPNK